jgi:enamine deaminase RidA (YjgF/YER057c/UK114 family)
MLTPVLLAAIAAAQPSPAVSPATAGPPFARRPENVVMPIRPESRRVFTEWGCAEAVIDGDHVWLSGVVAGLRPGETEADSEKAYDRAFRIIGDVLARAGSSFDGVVEMTTFHTDIAAQMDGFMKVKHRYIREPFPAWTAIDIDRLVPDRGLVEIKVVARRRPAAEKG